MTDYVNEVVYSPLHVLYINHHRACNMLASFLKSRKTFLAFIVIAILVISFTVHGIFVKVPYLALFPNDSPEKHGPTPVTITEPNPVTPHTKQTEEEQLEKEILNRMAHMIPTVKFTHIDNTTSAGKSKATIINPKDKYCVGDNLTVRVDMFDYLGKRKTYGGDFLRVRISTPDLEAGATGRIEDFNNGTYHVHFTLFWEGRVYFSLLLYHPSEGVSALWRARNQGYGLIQFTGTFVNANHQVKSECGFQLNTSKEICEYRDDRDRESFYCIKPENLHCGSLTYLQSFNRDLSFLSKLEKKLFSRDNVAVEIQRDFKYIDVSNCPISPVVNVSRQTPCKIGMESPYPSGFLLHNTWRPVFCRISAFHSPEQIQTCLSDKMVYMMGDSTLRQWFLHLVQTSKSLKNVDLHITGLETMRVAIDTDRNIKLQWKKHSHPIVASRFYSVKDDAYVGEEIDRLAGGPHTVIAISLGQHFRPFPLSLFIRRVINVRGAVKRLFLRSPETKVIIKAENTRESSIDAERFSDFHGYIQYLIVKDLFQDLRVAVVDAWDITIACNSYNVHPTENVIMNQVHMFLTYIC
ncbi:NXPE family member 4-like [Ascaphus truei]|uniref:NXPE family member 4-like n=1 Tax=Ascaphus truei TaxID=8439 RepID=UPI003F591087